MDYQERAVHRLLHYTSELLNNGEKNSLIIFKAPTGSGKTVMAAQFIKRATQEIRDDFCFIWISIGKGELHLQSKAKLEAIFEGTPIVSLLDEDYFGSRKTISSKEIVVVNWEKIRSKDRETGEWLNVLMRDGERLNFRDVLANTRDDGRKIIMIIDESHIGRGSHRTEEIKQEVDADLLIEITATPQIPADFNDALVDGKAGYVKVDIQDVIDAEMIKKQLIVNEGLQAREDAVMDKELLELAYQKREQLKMAYEKEGSSVNPLVLIQLPNSREGDVKKEFILQELREKGLTIENRKVAIWLSDDEDKVNLESISNPTDSVEFLLFKQAIDTGWDCPRAQVLVKYRETSSETFERQTLGRILRMPEQKHYEQEILNQAYVYTDYLGKILDIVDEDFDYPDERIKDITLFAKDSVEPIVLRSTLIRKKKKDVVKESLIHSFNTIIKEKSLERFAYEKNQKALGINNDLSQLTEKVIGEISIEIKDIVEKEQIEGDEVEFYLDPLRTQTIFERLLMSYACSIGNDQHRIFEILKEQLYKFAAYYVIDIHSLKDLLVDVQRLVILNYEKVFSKVLSDVVSIYKDVRSGDLMEVTIEEDVMYTIPQIISVSSETHEEVNLEKYYYDKCYLQKDRSNPERWFEAYIQQRLNVVDYWLKNGDSGNQYFCIPYRNGKEYKRFYPDYIVRFVDGRIGLFETKDKNDDSPETKAKAEALRSYIRMEIETGKRLTGGIVSNFGTKDVPYLKINQQERYTNKETEWVDLDEVFLQ